MNLSDLNKMLFKQLEEINKVDITDENLDVQIKKTTAVTNVATAIINNSNTVLKSMQFLDKRGYNTAVQTNANNLLGLDTEFDEEKWGNSYTGRK